MSYRIIIATGNVLHGWNIQFLFPLDHFHFRCHKDRTANHVPRNSHRRSHSLCCESFCHCLRCRTIISSSNCRTQQASGEC